jgi:hypothetical protein
MIDRQRPAKEYFQNGGVLTVRFRERPVVDKRTWRKYRIFIGSDKPVWKIVLEGNLRKRR